MTSNYDVNCFLLLFKYFNHLLSSFLIWLSIIPINNLILRLYPLPELPYHSFIMLLLSLLQMLNQLFHFLLRDCFLLFWCFFVLFHIIEDEIDGFLDIEIAVPNSIFYLGITVFIANVLSDLLDLYIGYRLNFVFKIFYTLLYTEFINGIPYLFAVIIWTNHLFDI